MTQMIKNIFQDCLPILPWAYQGIPPGPTTHCSSIVCLLSTHLARSLCVCQSTHLSSTLSICHHLPSYQLSVICLLMVSLSLCLSTYHPSYLSSIYHLAFVCLLSIYLYVVIYPPISLYHFSLHLSLYLFTTSVSSVQLLSRV